VSFDNYGEGRLVFKATPLSYSGSDVEGLLVSFSLRKTSACPTIDTFLAEWTYSIMSDLSSPNTKCCPTATLADTFVSRR
jgi:hypothetical protein